MRLSPPALTFTPREDLDELVDFLLSFAEEQLRAHGEFHPFAGKITTRGDLVPVAVDMGDHELPDPDVVIDALIAALRDDPDVRATGICFDVTLEEGTDAARVDLEHREADPVAVCLPYRRGRLRGLRFGEIFAAPGPGRIFA